MLKPVYSIGCFFIFWINNVSCTCGQMEIQTRGSTTDLNYSINSCGQLCIHDHNLILVKIALLAISYEKNGSLNHRVLEKQIALNKTRGVFGFKEVFLYFDVCDNIDVLICFDHLMCVMHQRKTICHVRIFETFGFILLCHWMPQRQWLLT